jgi:hypothetical protein
VNRQTVRSAADLQSAMKKSGSQPALLLVNRSGHTIFVTVRPR